MIFVSTGGYKDLSGLEALKLLTKYGFKNIELSGGKYSSTQISEIIKLSKKYNLQIHNYFPPSRKPFVLNLATKNKDIAKASISHVKHCIDLTKKTRGKYYSFHAGFLLDPLVNELGKKIEKKKIILRSDGIETFLKRVYQISKYAKKNNVEILIENNVLGRKNNINFKKNPFLMIDYREINHVMNNTPKNVNFLIDVAHLKVSSQVSGFDKYKVLEKCDKWIKAYHISDNDGEEDTNDLITEKSWFIPYLKKDALCTLEVYNQNLRLIKNQIKILQKNI